MLVSAFILGFFGSIHCVAMCGPLVIAFGSFSKGMKYKFIQQLGRLVGYGLLGVLMGLIGNTLVLFTLQQRISLIAGVLLLLITVLTFWKKKWFSGFENRFLSKIQSYLMSNIKNVAIKFFALGVLNAFLPCGLLYVALITAASLSSFEYSALYMVLFGLGTFPALLLVAYFGNRLVSFFKGFQKKWVPALTFAMGLFLVVRGMGLGIPYLSPKFNVETEVPECCKSSSSSVSCHE